MNLWSWLVAVVWICSYLALTSPPYTVGLLTGVILGVKCVFRLPSLPLNNAETVQRNRLVLLKLTIDLLVPLVLIMVPCCPVTVAKSLLLLPALVWGPWLLLLLLFLIRPPTLWPTS